MFGRKAKQKKNNENIEDILLQQKPDRRMLSYVPDKQHVRNNVDRRGGKTLETYEGKADDYIKSIQSGIRYQVNYNVRLTVKMKGSGRKRLTCKCIDISTTGLLLQMENPVQQEILRKATKIRLKFDIDPGSMPEGYEMFVKQPATLVRAIKTQDDKYVRNGI